MAFLQPLFKRLEAPMVPEPTPPGSKMSDEGEGVMVKIEGKQTVSEWERLRYTECMKMALRNEERLAGTLIALYNVVWGQCSDKMRNRLTGDEKFKMIMEDDDVVELLKLIKAISHEFSPSIRYEESVDEAGHKMMTYHQGEFKPIADHIRNINNLKHVMEHYECWMVNENALINAAKTKDKADGVTIKTDEEYLRVMRDKALALRVLKTTKYKAVLKNIRKKYLYKEDVYPRDLTEVQELLNHYVTTNKITEGKAGHKKSKFVSHNDDSIIKGAQYLQEEDKKKLHPGSDGKTYDIKCYNCNKFGHYAGQCPEIIIRTMTMKKCTILKISRSIVTKILRTDRLSCHCATIQEGKHLS